MKKQGCLKVLILSGIALTTLSVSSMAYTAQPVLINHVPEHAFIPLGFDDNDNTQVVVTGTLPNTCYRAGPAHIVRVDQQNHKIIVRNQAYLYRNTMCAMMTVPYVTTINLGVVPAGHYDLKMLTTEDQEEELADMDIVPSRNEGPDDYLYAPVQDAFLENMPARQQGVTAQSEQHTQPVLVLRGAYTNSCMRMQEVQVNVQANNVIVVLPIARLDENMICAERIVPFEHRVPLTSTSQGQTLIHVRTLNGQSINKVMRF